jgi:hypothetical protein
MSFRWIDICRYTLSRRRSYNRSFRYCCSAFFYIDLDLSMTITPVTLREWNRSWFLSAKAKRSNLRVIDVYLRPSSPAYLSSPSVATLFQSARPGQASCVPLVFLIKFSFLVLTLFAGRVWNRLLLESPSRVYVYSENHARVADGDVCFFSGVLAPLSWAECISVTVKLS